MAFTPVRMVAPDGREYVAGSATEREQLRTKGYTLAPERKPEPKPAPRVTDRSAAVDRKPTSK
ncbi:hypothetical protein [Nocardia otitidiscaviarum]|uniref:hypothetical protein n=1 Tax=Nocardia otitidiscaviarum TaxID=1823 RepID=UPI0005BB529A|nr:hypothetical protein [Nocardia otitidiscaviarum]